MGTSASQSEMMTSGAVAVAIGGGTQRHHIDRMARAGLIAHRWSGHIRLFASADLPAIRRVCEERGYCRPTAEPALV